MWKYVTPDATLEVKPPRKESDRQSQFSATTLTKPTQTAFKRETKRPPEACTSTLHQYLNHLTETVRVAGSRVHNLSKSKTRNAPATFAARPAMCSLSNCNPPSTLASEQQHSDRSFIQFIHVQAAHTTPDYPEPSYDPYWLLTQTLGISAAISERRTLSLSDTIRWMRRGKRKVDLRLRKRNRHFVAVGGENSSKRFWEEIT